jgi:hypothetical protein
MNEFLTEKVKQRLDPKCWKGNHKEGTKIKGGVRVNNCVPNESVEEAANPAQQAAIAINKKKAKGVMEMDNRTPSGDRREQRANSPEAIAQRKKELQANLKKVSPEMRKKLRLPEPKEGVTEEHNDTFDPKSHQYKTTMKHAKNSSVQQRMAAHDIKPGIAGYRDRIDMLKDLERTGKLKDQGVAEGAKPYVPGSKTLGVNFNNDPKELIQRALSGKASTEYMMTLFFDLAEQEGYLKDPRIEKANNEAAVIAYKSGLQGTAKDKVYQQEFFKSLAKQNFDAPNQRGVAEGSSPESTKLILENMNQAKKTFIGLGNPEDEVGNILRKFVELRDKNQLQGEQKDINWWVKQGFNNLKKMVIDLAARPTKRQQKLGRVPGERITLADTNEYTVTIPLTLDASRNIAPKSSFCTTKLGKEGLFDKYFGVLGNTIIYFKRKDTDRGDGRMNDYSREVFAIMHSPTQGITYWTFDNQRISNDDFYRVTKFWLPHVTAERVIELVKKHESTMAPYREKSRNNQQGIEKPKEQGVAEGENWAKHNNPRAGGMSKKSVSSYRRSHPGSKIQTAVTTKPSKLKKGSKSAKRRASFCARMRGMKKHRTGAKTARDPNSNINKSLRRWHCESIEELQQLVMLAEQFIKNNRKV